MNQVVLDSSILIAGVFSETLTPQATWLLKQLEADQILLKAPTLLRYECVAVVRKAVFQGRITPAEGLRARDALLSYPMILYYDETLLKRAYELAAQYNRPTAYDAQYLALAERLACDFWTADERLVNAVSPHLPQVKWVGSISPD